MADSRDPNFRHYYSNSFNFVMNENECGVNFGLQKTMFGAQEEGFEFQIGVILSLRAAKLLALGLTEAIAAGEDQFGKIVIAPEKMAELSQSMAQATKKFQAPRKSRATRKSRADSE